MDSFPYESWEEALAAAEQSVGYFTFGPGGNLASNIIVGLAIIMSIGFLVYLTSNEDRHMRSLAADLAKEWSE